ncbi:unnamed protein product [Sphacelaria rigidula]
MSKLITAADSYSGGGIRVGVGIGGNNHQDIGGGVAVLMQEERSGVTEAVVEETQTNLARLLGAIWRKLREESALLDFFLKRPDRTVTAGESAAWSVGKSVSAIDVFSSLLPLLELPGRAGLHAREACLVALSVKDSRIGTFVGGRTQFCTQLSRSLTARYLALYDTLEDLQTAAALVLNGEAAEGERKKEISPVDRSPVATEQVEEAEATFSESLSLFLQHLKFCNAVGLVAAGTRAACTRPPPSPSRPLSCVNGSDGGGLDSKGDIATSSAATESHDADFADLGDVASSLVSQVRRMLLGEAIGPALSSALESRAGIAQAIAARMITELSAGVEGYGVAVAGIAASMGEDGCRRQLGPLLDEVSLFLVGRENSWPTSGHDKVEWEGSNSAGDEDSIRSYSRGGGRVTGRDTLLHRVVSSSPLLRVSTLELVASLAELRHDRVLLDLVLVPKQKAAPPDAKAAPVPMPEGEAVHGQREEDGMQALLEPGGPLEDLRVTRAMVDSFGAAFVGSPIHPDFRRFASHVSLERYLVQAHQRQIQQLMTEARVSHANEAGSELELERTSRLVSRASNVHVDDMRTPSADARGSIVKDGGIESGGRQAELDGVGREGPGAAERLIMMEVFDAEGFARRHGATLAACADSPGSFLHALFDCLEAIFERTLDENVALTGVLSSLCLAATATEVSPVRRLLLVLLFDETEDAPFRSMRRLLQKLWVSAQARVASLPNAPRLLARARASLGMAAGDFLGPSSDEDEDEVEVEGIGTVSIMKGKSESVNHKDNIRSKGRKSTTRKSVGGSGCGEQRGRGDGEDAGEEGRRGGGGHSGCGRRWASREQARFLETYVFLEEFLKELFCVLQAKSCVETDARGLSESHRQETKRALQRLPSAEEGCHRMDPLAVGGAELGDDEEEMEEEDSGEEGDGSGGEGAGSALGKEMELVVEELPTSIDEFLRAAEFPTFASPP